MKTDYIDDDMPPKALVRQRQRLRTKLRRLIKSSLPRFKNSKNAQQNHANDNPSNDHEDGQSSSTPAQCL